MVFLQKKQHMQRSYSRVMFIIVKKARKPVWLEQSKMMRVTEDVGLWYRL